MTHLTRLIAGNTPDKDPMKSLIETLSVNMAELEETLVESIRSTQMTPQMILYGAYACRTFLESAMTSLLARIDPLRILFLQAHQNSTEYDKSQRNKSAVQWKGDIFSKEKAGENLWSIDLEKNTAWRALLGNWQQKMILEPSFQQLNDTNTTISSDWLANLKRISLDGIGNHFRGSADSLYSELSKAVHAEYVIPRRTVVDEMTIRDYISRTFQITAQISLISHFSPVFHCCLPHEEAFLLFKQTEEYIN